MKRLLCFFLVACALIFPAYADGTPSDEIRKAAAEMTEKYGLPDGLLLAVAEIESGFDPGCKNQWCSGLMQIHRTYAGTFAKEAGLEDYDLYDIWDSMEIAAYLLSNYYGKYGLHGCLMSYNLGEYGARSKMKNGVESTSYSRKVVAAMEKWKNDIYIEPEPESEVEIEEVTESIQKQIQNWILKIFRKGIVYEAL